MRIELIHPMLVHFPLALLLVGMALKVVAFFLRRFPCYRYLQVTSWINLGLGVCFAWMTVVAGELAEAVVRDHLCQVHVLNTHALVAYTTALLFTLAVLLDFGKNGIKRHCASWLYKVSRVIDALLFLAATCLLFFTGFLGGSLVYEQGAAVDKCQHVKL